jgi:zinc protease
MKILSLHKTLACTLLLIFTWTAQAALNLSDPLPINPQLKLGKLENGLTYFIQKNNKPEKRVELRLVLKAGSILEDDDQQGIAHLIEHMAFNGSTHFKKNELISYLQSLGIKYGPELNAYTGFNETVYMLTVPTDKEGNLETGLLVLEDWAQGLSLNDADIDTERNIVIEEARLGRGANDRMDKKLYPLLYNGSRYAERLPIGKIDIIRHASYDTIKRFYKDWYRPDLMAVVVVGDVEPEQAEQMVKTHFAKLKNPKPERPRNYVTIPARTKSTAIVITDKEATKNEQLIQYSIEPDKPEITIFDYRQSIIKNLSAAILNQRLQYLTQQAEPPFIVGASAEDQLVHGYKSFSSIALVGRTGTKPAINALIQENERARQFGFSPDELDRAKKDQLRVFESSYNERNKSESNHFTEEYIRHFLEGEAIPGIANEYNYVTELVPGITLEEVNAYARKHIPNSEAKLLAYLGSNKKAENIPTETQLLDWANTAQQLPVAANNEQFIPKQLMAKPPKAGSIVTETHNNQLGTTELTLSNGLKVLLKPTDFKDDQVLLIAKRFGGQSLFDHADIFNARYSNAIVDSMGLANYTPIELQKILAGESIFFQESSNNYIENLKGAAAQSDVESLFQFMHLRLAKPRLDPALFTAFITRRQDASRNTMERPETIFANTVSTTLYNNNPRVALAAKPSDFNHITMDRAAAIYSDRYTSAKGFTFILVGNFDLEKIKPLIATYLASLPTKDILLTYRDLHIRPVTGVVKKEVHAGSEDKSQVALIFTGPAKYSKEENMRLNALIEVMNLRINDVIREKLTLIYSGKMKGGIDRIPYENYRLNINLPCSPENVGKVIAATFSEIEKLKKDGPTEEELNKVKTNWIKNNNIALLTNEYWLESLQNAKLYNIDPEDILTIEKRINAVTQQDIKDAARRYLNVENYVQVVLYPEK